MPSPTSLIFLMGSTCPAIIALIGASCCDRIAPQRYVKQDQGGPGPEEPEPEPSQEQQAMNMDVVKKPNEPGKSPTYYYSENGNM